jgi:AraC-like DNA-binding protein
VLLELVIPGIDGITFMGRLRDTGVEAPVIVITGIDHAEPAVTAVRQGALDYVVKPFQDQVLLAAVVNALALAPAAAELRPPLKPPGIVLVGCQRGTAAALWAALAGHARLDTLPASLHDMWFLVHPGPDIVVLDAEAVPAPGHAVARLDSNFPDASLIVLNGTARGPRRADDLAISTVIPPPVTMRELLDGLRRELRPSMRPLPVFSARVIDAMEYVSHHFMRLSLRDLGRELGTSPYYLSRLFRAEMGQTLKTFVNRVRVDVARQLLGETQDKVETIAAAVGCHDASHLSRLCVQYLGRRPGDLRRKRA